MRYLLLSLSILLANLSLAQEVTVLTNQVVYNSHGPKTGILKTDFKIAEKQTFSIVDADCVEIYTGSIESSEQVSDWSSEDWYSSLDFSEYEEEGFFRLGVKLDDKQYYSHEFQLASNGLGKIAIPAITNFFNHQRADSPEELEADKQLLLFGSDTRVDLQGGWCDASGDVSKYFSHLAYTNFMSPQQIPLVTWSMFNTIEQVPRLLEAVSIKEELIDEALYGADYIMRSLSPEGFFYMTVFSYFDPNPSARRVVGLLADSKTTNEYQCSWREGAGMGIAALARASKLAISRDFTPQEYLAAAERAFSHALKYSTTYADDGKDNIIDDYTALTGATELWIVTNKSLYRDEARKRAANLSDRMTEEGYFISNDDTRPFWHASDAGLPIISLVRYLDMEKDSAYRDQALATIKKAIDYNLKVTAEVTNPFGYPRQTFAVDGKIKNGYFIPHQNESGWWWQGEDARLGSLAAAMILGGKLVYPSSGTYGVSPEIALFAERLTSWVLGTNPYDMCMMYGYGSNNVPYMASLYGHGSGEGGISNGITGKDGNPDGSGIDFKVEDDGNEWRWSEQWIPHTGWFLQAVTAMSENSAN